MKIKSVEPIYTGGGIYIFLGAVDDNYFIADSLECDVRIVDEDPRNHTDDERFGYEEWASAEWQEEHLVKDLTSDRKTFFVDMLRWVFNNEPDGNYLMSDIDYLLADIQNKQDW